MSCKAEASWTLTHPDDWQIAYDTIEEVLAKGAPTAEFRILTRSGDAIPHAFTSNSKTDEKGNVTGFFGIGKNIADQKQAEDALRQSKERYEGIFNESIAAIYVFDAMKTSSTRIKRAWTSWATPATNCWP